MIHNVSSINQSLLMKTERFGGIMETARQIELAQELTETFNIDGMNELFEIVDNAFHVIAELEAQLEQKSQNVGRKQQVLEILETQGPLTIKDIASKLHISTKNVSSQLTYLRTDGYEIFTDNNGKKFLN
jgi:biotin operon repressor